MRCAEFSQPANFSTHSYLLPPFSLFLLDSTTSDSLKSKVSQLPVTQFMINLWLYSNNCTCLKISSGSKKELNARDFLPMSIISAVTRKRKKCLSIHLPGSSAEEDSEHEPVKTNNYQAGGGAQVKQQRDEEEQRDQKVESSEKEHKTSKKERKDGKEAGLRQEWRTDVRNGATAPPRVQTGTLASTLPVRTRSAGPLWIRPTQRPPIQRLPAQRPDWNQVVPLRHRKTRGGRTRAVSMTLELEVGRREADEGQEGGGTSSSWRGSAAASDTRRMAHGAPPPSSSSSSSSSPTPPSVWTGKVVPGSSLSSAGVLRRRTTLDPRDKTKAWRRHTIIV